MCGLGIRLQPNGKLNFFAKSKEVTANESIPRRTREWLALEQIYQKIYGSYQIDNVAVPIESGWLHGEEIRFTVNSVAYTGRISGNSMAGVAEGSITCEWRATLVSQ